MLIGGKPTPNESKRSSKKRSNANSETAAVVAGTATISASTGSPTTATTTDAATVNTAKPKSLSNSALNVATTPQQQQQQTQSNDSKIATEGQPIDDTATTTAGAPATGSTGSTGAAALPTTAANGINKKIPKHKWRPLQIDLAKSSRAKPISRNTRRVFPTNVRTNNTNERSNERRQNNNTANDGNEGERSKNASTTERIDSWRSGSGTERNSERATDTRDYERSMRTTNRRFRPSFRGGRQGRGGGFSRQGPGRTANRLPRHLLANGEYASYLPADAAGAERPFVLMGTHYYGPVPAAYIEMDAQSVKGAIKKQV